MSFMNETSPTLGSITSSEAEKKLFAKKSKAFNLKSKHFCELFPALAEKYRKEIRDQNAQEQKSLQEEEERIKNQRTQSSGLSALVSNLIVIAGIVALAFAVRWVVQTAQDQDPYYQQS